MKRFSGAILTWLPVPAALVWCGMLNFGLAISTSYHPQAPFTYRLSAWLWIAVAGLCAVIFLAIRHSQIARRQNLRRNLKELAVVPALMAVAMGISWFTVTGPSFRTVIAFGEIYTIPSVYKPYKINGTDGQALSVVIELCNATFAPVYAPTGTCHAPVLASLGKTDLLADFRVSHALTTAGAGFGTDVIHDPGRHQKNPKSGELVYRMGGYTVAIRVDASGRVQQVRQCSKSATIDCQSYLRWGDKTLSFPIHQDDTDIAAAALRWQTLFDNWR